AGGVHQEVVVVVGVRGAAVGGAEGARGHAAADGADHVAVGVVGGGRRRPLDRDGACPEGVLQVALDGGVAVSPDRVEVEGYRLGAGRLAEQRRQGDRGGPNAGAGAGRQGRGAEGLRG